MLVENELEINPWKRAVKMEIMFSDKKNNKTLAELF
jgi:hypothetical protein